LGGEGECIIWFSVDFGIALGWCVVIVIGPVVACISTLSAVLATWENA